MAWCQGTPLRNEIEARDTSRLAQPPYGTLMPQSGRRSQHQSRHTNTATVSPNVRFAQKAFEFRRRTESTRCATNGLMHRRKPALASEIG